MSTVSTSLIAAFLRAAATAAPLITTSKRSEAYSSALNYGATLIELGAAGTEELNKMTEHLKELHAAGATVADEDFDGLKSRSDAAHAAIQQSGEVPHSTAAPIEAPPEEPAPVETTEEAAAPADTTGETEEVDEPEESDGTVTTDDEKVKE